MGVISNNFLFHNSRFFSVVGAAGAGGELAELLLLCFMALASCFMLEWSAVVPSTSAWLLTACLPCFSPSITG